MPSFAQNSPLFAQIEVGIRGELPREKGEAFQSDQIIHLILFLLILVFRAHAEAILQGHIVILLNFNVKYGAADLD